jgi:hypothetical protein
MKIVYDDSRKCNLEKLEIAKMPEFKKLIIPGSKKAVIDLNQSKL